MPFLQNLMKQTVLIVALVVVIILGSCAALLLVRHASQTSTALPHATPTALPTTAPGFANLAAPHPLGVDFATFYSAAHGANWLGSPISPELPTNGGQQQMFTNGVLQRVGTRVTVAPVVTALITYGAAIPLADPTSSLTYASLRAASDAAALVQAPWWWSASKDPTVAGIFVTEMTRQNVAYGHYIPAASVPFLQSLGAWQTLIGPPLTEVQIGTILVKGQTEHIVVQAFAQGMLWYDQAQSGTPQIHLQTVGADDLATFGWPPLTIPPNTAAWTLGSPMRIASGPGKTDDIATLLTPFAVLLAGDDRWVGHALWLHVRWQNFLSQRDGWVDADQLSYTKPNGAGMQLADLDALSPQLMADASAEGYNLTMAVYDPDSGHYYADNPYFGLEMASMFKVPIIATLMHMVEQQGRGLTSEEQAEATAMIEVSDNVAEGGLYDDVGDYDGVTNYMRSIGISDIQINTDGIGSTLLSPLSSIKLLDDIRTARILTPQDCQYILSLMSHVIYYQQFGVGDTAPAGATFALKDGYGPGEDTLNLADSMGIVTYKGHSYLIAIYTRDNQTVPAGEALVDHLCSEAVAALVGSG